MTMTPHDPGAPPAPAAPTATAPTSGTPRAGQLAALEHSARDELARLRRAPDTVPCTDDWLQVSIEWDISA